MSNLPGWDYLCEVMEKSAGPRWANMDIMQKKIKELLAKGLSPNDVKAELSYPIYAKEMRLRSRLENVNPIDRIVPGANNQLGPMLDPSYLKQMQEANALKKLNNTIFTALTGPRFPAGAKDDYAKIWGGTSSSILKDPLEKLRQNETYERFLKEMSNS